MIVLIVDESRVVREVLARRLIAHPEVEAIDTAPDTYTAREKIAARRPDLLVLDNGLPGTDAGEFLTQLHRHCPIPTVVFTASDEDPDTASRLLELGALDVVAKPESGKDPVWLESLNAGIDLVHKESVSSVPISIQSNAQRFRSAEGPRLIAVGASTGGPIALETFCSGLPSQAPPIVIAQHVPPKSAGPLANRLDRSCGLKVKIAEQNEALRPGTVYLAPGELNLHVIQKSGSLRARVATGPTDQHQYPSIDVLLTSVADSVGGSAIGVVLTGMGNDGVQGVRRLRDSGAYTIGQDAQTCAAYEMPRRAGQLGALVESLPLPQIAARAATLLGLPPIPAVA